MVSKFKEGESVVFLHRGQDYKGTIEIIDVTDKGYRYDVMCILPEKILIKHIYEDDPHLRKA